MSLKKQSRRKPSLSAAEVRSARETGPIGRYVGSQIRLTHVAANDALERLMTPHKSTPVRFALLDHANEFPGSTQATLAEILDVDRTTLVPMIAALERQGLIRRERLPGDKRASQVWVTPSGQALLNKLKPLARLHDRAVRRGLSDREVKTLLSLLQRVRDNLVEP